MEFILLQTNMNYLAQFPSTTPQKKIILYFLITLVFPRMSLALDILQATKEGDLVGVRALIAEDATNLHRQDADGFTPLHLSAIYGHVEMTTLLLQSGANINHRENRDDFTPLQCSVFYDETKNRINVVDQLLSAGALVETTGSVGRAMLHESSEAGLPSLVRRILDTGIDVNEQDVYGLNALHRAASAGHLEVVRMLIEAKAELDVVSHDGRRPLTMARASHEDKVVEVLISRGADEGPRQFPVLRGPYLGMKPPGFVPELFAPGIVSTEGREHSVLCFAPDGSTLYYSIHSQSPEGEYFQPMQIMRQMNGRWSPRVDTFPITYRSSPGDFTPSGDRFYFDSVRPVEPGGEPQRHPDLWYLQRTSSGWSPPIHVKGEVNSSFSDGAISFTRDSVAYFSSRRSGNSDIYRTALIDGSFSKPEKLPMIINTDAYEAVPLIAPDESYLLWYRNDRRAGRMDMNLMLSFRDQAGGWSSPIELTELLNLKGSGLQFARLSPDGRFLFILDDDDYYWVDADVIEQFRNYEREQ